MYGISNTQDQLNRLFMLEDNDYVSDYFKRKIIK